MNQETETFGLQYDRRVTQIFRGRHRQRQRVHLFLQAALKKCLRLGQLKMSEMYTVSFGGWKFEIKELAGPYSL